MKSKLELVSLMLSLSTLTSSLELKNVCVSLHSQIDVMSPLHKPWGMLMEGPPAGPAGTGKTETVKDLGRTLGVFVVVTNCSGEHKFRDMAKIFKGLCQSGLWGCFDEFNRISLATLSVVAAQVEAITAAKKADAKNFLFPNDPVSVGLVKSCAYFITMNPGYARKTGIAREFEGSLQRCDYDAA